MDGKEIVYTYFDQGLNLYMFSKKVGTKLCYCSSYASKRKAKVYKDQFFFLRIFINIFYLFFIFPLNYFYPISLWFPSKFEQNN